MENCAKRPTLLYHECLPSFYRLTLIETNQNIAVHIQIFACQCIFFLFSPSSDKIKEALG